jgi:hypothetical protein
MREVVVPAEVDAAKGLRLLAAPKKAKGPVSAVLLLMRLTTGFT